MIGPGQPLFQHGIGCFFPLGGSFPVLHQLGVDVHIQAGAIQSGPAESGTHAHIGQGDAGTLFRQFLQKGNGLGAGFHNAQRHLAGVFQAFFHHFLPVSQLFRRIFGQTIGLGQRLKGVGIGLYQILQMETQLFPFLQNAQDVFFHGGVLLFAPGKIADHAAQGHAQSAA